VESRGRAATKRKTIGAFFEVAGGERVENLVGREG